MRRASDRKKRQSSKWRLKLGVHTLLGVAMMAGLVFAQPQPTNTGKKAAPKVAAKKGTPKKPSKRARNTSASRKKSNRRPMQMDENAKWACENTTITLEPIWRGPKGIECSFDIRNDGTAPLHIQARGG